jgi:hypothetical protein
MSICSSKTQLMEFEGQIDILKGKWSRHEDRGGVCPSISIFRLPLPRLPLKFDFPFVSRTHARTRTYYIIHHLRGILAVDARTYAAKQARGFLR